MNIVSNYKELEVILFLLSVQTGKEVQRELVANKYDNTSILLGIDLNHFNGEKHDGNEKIVNLKARNKSY